MGVKFNKVKEKAIYRLTNPVLFGVYTSKLKLDGRRALALSPWRILHLVRKSKIKVYIYTGALIGDGGNPEATLGNRIRAAIAIDIEATRMAAQFSLAHGHFRHHVLVLD